MKHEWKHRHPPELHAIALGLCEELPKHLPDLRYLFNAVDCEVMVMRGKDPIANLDLDDEIEVWTTDSPCGVAGRVDYANPTFVENVATIIKRLDATTTNDAQPAEWEMWLLGQESPRKPSP